MMLDSITHLSNINGQNSEREGEIGAKNGSSPEILDYS
jgi:hypothetical protein